MITVNVAGDAAVEPTEGFTVTLSSPSTGATITTASATGTITSDDTQGIITMLPGQATTTQVGTANTIYMPDSGSAALYSNGSDTIFAGAGTNTIHVGANSAVVNEGAGRMSFISDYGSNVVINMKPGNAAGSILSLKGDTTINAAGTFSADDGGIGAGADYYNITRGTPTHITISEFGDFFHLIGFSSSEALHVVTTAQSTASG